MKLAVYKGFDRKGKTLIKGGIVAGLAVIYGLTLTACNNTNQYKPETYLSEEFLTDLDNAIKNHDCEITYVEQGDFYIIECAVYKYDINDPDYKEYLRTDTFKISGDVARSLGYSVIFDNNQNTKTIGK